MSINASRHLAVIVTCHNRKAATLATFATLKEQRGRFPPTRTYLVDDGSTDGTACAVASLDAKAVIIRGSGDLYWGGGMRVAMARAAQDKPSAYLWLNDDVQLFPDALADLFAVASANPSAIVVGTTVSPVDGTVTYGGLKRRSRYRFRFDRIHPQSIPIACDTFNGNVVWIPASVPQRIGGLDPRFRHSMGDIDFGLRARKANIPLLVAPGTHGYCPRNALAGSWRDPRLGRAARFAAVVSPKGLPPSQWAHLLRRHGGLAWPLQWASPYFKVLMGLPT